MTTFNVAEAAQEALSDYQYFNEADKIDSEDYCNAFEAGVWALESELGRDRSVADSEALRELPVGSLIRDARERLLFRTHANGWVTVNATHLSTAYVPFPIKVEYVPAQ